MKKIIITIMLSSFLSAGNYDSFMNPYLDEIRLDIDSAVAQIQNETRQVQKETSDIGAGLIAISAIDFTKDTGFSIGAGYGELSTYIGVSKAGAVGINYGYRNVSVNVKGWKTKEAHSIGVGAVIGF